MTFARYNGFGSSASSSLAAGTDISLSTTGGITTIGYSGQWKDPVANMAALPAVGNTPGDARVTLDTDLVWIWNGTTWSASAGMGTVTAVTASSPLSSSGGTTPHISLSQANTSTSGYLSNTDWNTFNGKQAAGNYITALTGDGTATGPGSSALTLATVNSNVGSYTLSNITVNAKGLVTAAASGTLSSVIGWAAGAVGGPALVTGQITGFFVAPYSGTITGWNIAVDQGTLTFKTWKIAAGTAVPTSANSINTSGVSISTGTVIESTTTSDFTTTTITAGDIIAFTITAVSSTTYASGSLNITRTA